MHFLCDYLEVQVGSILDFSVILFQGLTRFIVYPVIFGLESVFSKVSVNSVVIPPDDGLLRVLIKTPLKHYL